MRSIWGWDCLNIYLQSFKDWSNPSMGLISDRCSAFQTDPLKTSSWLWNSVCAAAIHVMEGGSVTRAMMLQLRGCCWTREIFVVNTSGWLCCDIPVCQSNPASKTPALCNFNLLRNGKASLTDKRGSRSLEGLTGVMEKHLIWGRLCVSVVCVS